MESATSAGECWKESERGRNDGLTSDRRQQISDLFRSLRQQQEPATSAAKDRGANDTP